MHATSTRSTPTEKKPAQSSKADKRRVLLYHRNQLVYNLPEVQSKWKKHVPENICNML